MNWRGLEKHLRACRNAVDSVSKGVAKERDKEYLQDLIEKISDGLADLDSPSLKPLPTDVDLLIAVVGSFSSGKSTFLNYILGERLCPTETDVTTKQNTLFKYGNEPKINDASGKVWSLSDYRNKVRDTDLRKTDENGAHFIIEKPLDILKKWRFLDTPGRMATNDNNERCVDDDEKSEEACQKADCIIYLLGDEFSGGDGDDGDQGFLKKDCFYDEETQTGKPVVFVRSLIDHEENEKVRQKKLRKIKEELESIEEELGNRSPRFIGPLPCGWLRGTDDRAKTTMGAILEELENLHHVTRNDVKRKNNNRRAKYLRKVKKCEETVLALKDYATYEKGLTERDLEKVSGKYAEDEASEIADELLNRFAQNARTIGVQDPESFVSFKVRENSWYEPDDYFPYFNEEKIRVKLWKSAGTDYSDNIAKTISRDVATCAERDADEYFAKIANVLKGLFDREVYNLQHTSFENRWGIGADERAKNDGTNYLSTWCANLECYLKEKDIKEITVSNVKEILAVCRKKTIILIKDLEHKIASCNELIVEIDSILKFLQEDR